MARRAKRESLASELFLTRRSRLRLVGEGSLVGLVAGVTIALYRYALSHAEALLRTTTQWLSQNGPWVFVWPIVLVVLCLAVAWLMLFEPYTQGSGIPQVDAEVAGRIDMPWHRVLIVKFIEGTLCAFAGLSLGREGPSVQLGSMTGKGVSKLFGDGRDRERLMVTCGAAAGMSAAFHAPLSGVLFAIEEIHREFSAGLVTSVMAASVVADFISSQVLGITPLIHFVSFSTLPHNMYAFVLLLGVACGALGAGQNAGMFWIQDRLFGRLEQRTPAIRLAIPFALAGICAFTFSDLMCGGDAILERILDVEAQPTKLLFALLVGKYLFTAICFGSGAPGGTLLPLVVLGSLVGAIYGRGVAALTGMEAYANSFVVLGVAGLFAGSIQAPVTAVILVFELTGNLDALLSMSLVSVISYVTACLLRGEPFYEHLCARLLGDTPGETRRRGLNHQKLVRNFVVSPGSYAEGRLIKDIAWPEGVLVITVRRAGVELVAKGDTNIEALDELCLVMESYREEETTRALHAICASE